MASNDKSNKAAKPKDDLTTSLNLSNRDVEVLIKGYNCMKEGAQIDYKKLAELGNFKTADSAMKQWSKTRSKLKKMNGGGDDAGGTGTNTLTPKRKRPAKAVVDDDDDDDPTPTKRSCGANDAV